METAESDRTDAVETVIETGAESLTAAVDTHWGNRNQQFRAKNGLQYPA